MFRYLLPLVAVAAVVSVHGSDNPIPADAKKHWSFIPPVRPAVPEGTFRNPIDAFVRARLQKEGLKPSSETDKITLCRRLFLDLIGLPPSPKEVDDFVNDNSKNAYEKLVEKLLASPHYGEKWARWWLDAARYADSDGYEKDMSREVWAYRDWVIKALNQDMPYSQFVIEQLAGDLLPNATQDQIVATGFIRMSMLNEEGGIDPEQFRMDAMFDRMDAIGKAFLGLSIACCQCHDHKFDPISQHEYYQLFAFLNNDHESQRVVYTPDEQMKINSLREQIRAIETKLKQSNPDWEKKLAAWEARLPKEPAWKTVAVENAGDNSQRYLPQKDGSILAQGYAPTKFSTLMRGPSPLKTITAFRIELLNDPNLPCNGPGRSWIGTSALTEFVVEVENAKTHKRQRVKFARAMADFDQPVRELEKRYDDQSGKKRVTGPISYAIDGKDLTAWGIDAGPGRRNVPRVAVFIPEEPLTLPDGDILHYDLKQLHGGWNSDDHMNHNLGRFRLSVTDEVVKEKPFPPVVRAALDVPAKNRSPAQAETVFAQWRTTMKDFATENSAIESLWKQWPEGATSLVAQKRHQPRDTFILKRGNFLKHGDQVDAGVPAILNPLPKDADGSRLTLAKWIVDTKAPTTARAIVNRVWQAYFGAGLVNTPEEFGTQGAKPSHPELLDWLACEFMEHGWSFKHLHRLIVTSATYRQSSRVTEELLAKDPENRLLARGPRFRADAEVVRDIALSASGLLNPKVGGPSIFSPAPLFLFQRPVSYGPFVWDEAKGSDRYRRALYTFRRRSTPYPALTVFDAPIGEASCVKRARSNTPLQALTGLNESIFVESARALGKRAILEGGKRDEERLTYAFRLCVARKPTADELAILSTLLEKGRERFASGEANAAEVATGEKAPKTKPPGELNYPEWAAYTLVARVVLNLDETVTKE
ncbi:MAG TPA: DUF1549 and DUF1553 domain-containing protein [Gemmata sp.]|nr:DUF1549 and DUF1553 domain-containing protein [Gemmata sp.]